MTNIVAFPSRKDERVVWRCNCGCVSFELRGDGAAVCAQCLKPVLGHEGEWRALLPNVPAEPTEIGAGDMTVTDLNSSEAALRRTLGKAEPGTTAMVIIIQQEGSVSTWGDWLETDAQADWFDRRISTAKTMLTKRHHP